MSNVVGLINYGIAGNIHSIQKAIERAGGEVKVVSFADEISHVDKIVLPGVGSFKDAMCELQKDKLLEPIKGAICEKPTLGICLGMQILSTLGFEYGKSSGLGVIKAEVRRMQVDAKVPHMGFNTIETTRYSKLLAGIENEEFYFMHSYEVVNYTDITSLAEYAGHKFVSSIEKDNIYGVQFHPEKSREAGVALFRNFLAL